MSKYQEIQDYIKWYQEKYTQKDGTKPVPIFEIMVFEHPNKELTYQRPDGITYSGYPDTGCVDRMGFYYELDTAIQAMNENLPQQNNLYPTEIRYGSMHIRPKLLHGWQHWQTSSRSSHTWQLPVRSPYMEREVIQA